MNGIDSFTLEELMKHEINFKGCYMRNERLPKSGNYILNLDIVENAGTHWVAVYGNEYYDSFGLAPPSEIEHKINKYNIVQHQKLTSSLCGLFACLYIHYRNYGYTPYDICYFILKHKSYNKNELRQFLKKHMVLCRLQKGN